MSSLRKLQQEIGAQSCATGALQVSVPRPEGGASHLTPPDASALDLSPCRVPCALAAAYPALPGFECRPTGRGQRQRRLRPHRPRHTAHAARRCTPPAADKTLKKVQEGLEVFDDHQEQYDATDGSNANAREKLESQVGALAGRGARPASGHASPNCHRAALPQPASSTEPCTSLLLICSSRTRSRSCSGCATPSKHGEHPFEAAAGGSGARPGSCSVAAVLPAECCTGAGQSPKLPDTTRRLAYLPACLPSFPPPLPTASPAPDCPPLHRHLAPAAAPSLLQDGQQRDQGQDRHHQRPQGD
jgi:hypothetical protein